MKPFHLPLSCPVLVSASTREGGCPPVHMIHWCFSPHRCIHSIDLQNPESRRTELYLRGSWALREKSPKLKPKTKYSPSRNSRLAYRSYSGTEAYEDHGGTCQRSTRKELPPRNFRSLFFCGPDMWCGLFEWYGVMWYGWCSFWVPPFHPPTWDSLMYFGPTWLKHESSAWSMIFCAQNRIAEYSPYRRMNTSLLRRNYGSDRQ